MRFQGKISDWNDEKGYGFVEPNEQGTRLNSRLFCTWYNTAGTICKPHRLVRLRFFHQMYSLTAKSVSKNQSAWTQGILKSLCTDIVRRCFSSQVQRKRRTAVLPLHPVRDEWLPSWFPTLRQDISIYRDLHTVLHIPSSFVRYARTSKVSGSWYSYHIPLGVAFLSCPSSARAPPPTLKTIHSSVFLLFLSNDLNVIPLGWKGKNTCGFQ